MDSWVLLAVVIVGFIITWIACSKPATIEDLSPGSVYPLPYASEKEMLRSKVYTLERQLYSLQREYDYFRGGRWDLDAMSKILERPVEVNVDVKVELDETNCKSSRR
jgi:hypothetical protein